MKLFLTVMIVVALVSCGAAAEIVSWSGSATNDSWAGGPWWPAHDPTSADLVRIQDGNWWPDTGPHVEVGINAYASSIEIGSVGRQDGNGYLFIDGGQLDVTGNVQLGLNATSTGTIVVNSGTMNIGGNLLGWYGGGTVDVYGGKLDVAGWLVAGQFNPNTKINIYGGELESVWLGGQGVINIEEGTFIISQSADKRPDLQAMIDAGRIVAYDGDLNYELELAFDGTDNRVTAVLVPEPMTMLLLGTGAIAVLKRKRSAS